MRRRDGLAVFTKTFDVKFYRLANEAHCFFAVLADGNTARKVWNICAK